MKDGGPVSVQYSPARRLSSEEVCTDLRRLPLPGLEVEAQRELNLPVRAQAHRPLHRAVDDAERACQRGREGLAGLERRAAAVGVGQRRRWVGEVRHVEDVEDLRAELDVDRFGDG